MASVLDQLVQLNQRYPTDHKLLLCADVNYGRELLSALALQEGGWLGWEPTTLRLLANDLGFIALDERQLRVGGDLEIAALVDRAISAVVDRGQASPGLAGLARSTGFRRALHDALLELRMAGIGPERVIQATERGTPAHDLALIQRAYLQLSAAEGLIDSAGVFELALAAFDAEAPAVVVSHLFIAPDLAPRGLPARLLSALQPLATRVLSSPVTSTGEVQFELFRAATPLDELREVARRIRAEDLRWDEVEVVSTDPDAYGAALDVLASTCDIPVTSLEGIPLGRSRLGRVFERWYHWLEEGLPADRIRHALEAGDLAAGGESGPPWQARAFRALGIGWGRARYEAALAGLRADPAGALPRGRTAEPELSQAEWSAARVAVANLMETLLAITPKVPEPGLLEEPLGSVGALAAATRGLLALVPVGDRGEGHARGRLAERLTQLVEMEHRPVPFGQALAQVRQALADFRVWPDPGNEHRPRQSTGGRLHLTGLQHAGTSGRRRSFVVGLDADRTAGPRVPDPILPDALRHALGGGLATTATRREERRRLVARTIAGLQGAVTLSYSVESDGGRESSPAALLLEVMRRSTGLPELDYRGLRAALGPPACPVPGPGRPPFDRRDVWLAAIAPDNTLRNGTDAVLSLHPGLRHGLEALRAWTGATLSSHHGIVPDGAELDPRLPQGRRMSASSLEQLARCPRAWFYAQGLRLVAPADPVFTPDSWLDAAQQGVLLHDALEEFGRSLHERQELLGLPDAERELMAIGRGHLERFREQVPAPSSVAVSRQWNWLEESLRSFLSMEREQRRRRSATRWFSYELAFGFGDAAVDFPLPDGRRVRLTGRIDRVDRDGAGNLTVIDYKSGSSRPYRRDATGGAFAGGRHLQAGLYAAVAEQRLGAPVEQFEYRFPTAKGERQIVPYGRGDLEITAPLVSALLDEVSEGHFLVTTEASDCRICDFAPVCRVREGRFACTSPRAVWAKDAAPALPVYRPMLTRRGKAGA